MQPWQPPEGDALAAQWQSPFREPPGLAGSPRGATQAELPQVLLRLDVVEQHVALLRSAVTTLQEARQSASGSMKWGDLDGADATVDAAVQVKACLCDAATQTETPSNQEHVGETQATVSERTPTAAETTAPHVEQHEQDPARSADRAASEECSEPAGPQDEGLEQLIYKAQLDGVIAIMSSVPVWPISLREAWRVGDPKRAVRAIVRHELRREPVAGDAGDFRFVTEAWVRGGVTVHRCTLRIPMWHFTEVGCPCRSVKEAERRVFGSTLVRFAAWIHWLTEDQWETCSKAQSIYELVA